MAPKTKKGAAGAKANDTTTTTLRESGWARAADLTVATSGARGYERARATETEDATLEASIRDRGVLQSVLVERLPTGGLLVRNGRRRTNAAFAIGPDTQVPYLVLTEAEATLADAELELLAHELNATSVPPNPADLAKSARAAIEAGVPRERVITAIGGVGSRLTRLLAIADRAGSWVADALRYGNITESGAMILIEGAGTGDDAHAVQEAAVAILDEEARWASKPGEVGTSNRLTGAARATDIEVVDYAGGQWSASRAACEVAIARAAEKVGKKTRRVSNQKPVLSVVPPVAEAPAAPVAEAPAAPAPETATQAAPVPVDAPAEAPTAQTPDQPADAPQKPAKAALAPVIEKATPPAVRPQGQKAPVAPKKATLEERVKAASSRAGAVALKKANDKQRGALLMGSAILAYLATGKRPEGAVHEAIGSIFDTIFPTDD